MVGLRWKVVLLVGALAAALGWAPARAAVVATRDASTFAALVAGARLDVQTVGVSGPVLAGDGDSDDLPFQAEATGGVMLVRRDGADVLQTVQSDRNLALEFGPEGVRGFALEGGVATADARALGGRVTATLVTATGRYVVEDILRSDAGTGAPAAFAGIVSDSAILSAILSISRVDQAGGSRPYITLSAVHLAATPVPAGVLLLSTAVAMLGLFRPRAT